MSALVLVSPLAGRLARGAAALIDGVLLALPVEVEELGRDAYGFRTTYGFLGAVVVPAETKLDFD